MKKDHRMSDQQQDLAQEVLPINIEDELKQSYMDYAMSVIVGRIARRPRWLETRSSSRLVRHERVE